MIYKTSLLATLFIVACTLSTAASALKQPKKKPVATHSAKHAKKTRSASQPALPGPAYALRADAMQAADDIAERSVSLAGVVAGTSQAVSKGSQLEPYPADAIDEKTHLQALADRLAAYGKLARAAIDAADEAGDKNTADLFTGVSRQIDKDLWFIEAHLQ